MSRHWFWAVVLLLVGCGGVAPDIIELRWRLNIQFTPREVGTLQNETTLGHETLSVFIHPGDNDGLGDLDSMYLIHRGEDLFWALDSSQWRSITSSSIFWVGSNDFSSGYMQRFPRGLYTVELYDKAGESDRRNFELTSEDTRSFSSLVAVPPIGDQLLFLLPDDVSRYAIVGYNVNNDVLFTDANYQSIISLRELKIRNDELDKVMLSFRFPESNVTARIGPYLVPRIGNAPEAPIDTYIPSPEQIEEVEPVDGSTDPNSDIIAN